MSGRKKQMSPTRKQRRMRGEPTLTKQEFLDGIERSLARYPTTEDVKRMMFESIEQALVPYATKRDLELWGHALREAFDAQFKATNARFDAAIAALPDKIAAQLSIELARHVQASNEEMRTQVAAVDDKYADLPERVTRLEARAAKR